MIDKTIATSIKLVDADALFIQELNDGLNSSEKRAFIVIHPADNPFALPQIFKVTGKKTLEDGSIELDVTRVNLVNWFVFMETDYNNSGLPLVERIEGILIVQEMKKATEWTPLPKDSDVRIATHHFNSSPICQMHFVIGGGFLGTASMPGPGNGIELSFAISPWEATQVELPNRKFVMQFDVTRQIKSQYAFAPPDMSGEKFKFVKDAWPTGDEWVNDEQWIGWPLSDSSRPLQDIDNSPHPVFGNGLMFSVDAPGLLSPDKDIDEFPKVVHLFTAYEFVRVKFNGERFLQEKKPTGKAIPPQGSRCSVKRVWRSVLNLETSTVGELFPNLPDDYPRRGDKVYKATPSSNITVEK